MGRGSRAKFDLSIGLIRMGWEPLGAVTIGEDWVSVPSDVLNCETFRLTHQTIVDPSVNMCFVTQYFPLPAPGGRHTSWRRVYPSNEAQIITLPIPSDYRKIEAVIFTLQFKIRFPYYPVPWIINVEALY